MQRPRFKRHWDDRKWQNPINSMTESATSNMRSSGFVLVYSLLPVAQSLPLTPIPSCLSSPFCSCLILRMCLCVVLLTPRLSFSPSLSSLLVFSFLSVQLPFLCLFSLLWPFSVSQCVFHFSQFNRLPVCSFLYHVFDCGPTFYHLTLNKHDFLKIN